MPAKPAPPLLSIVDAFAPEALPKPRKPKAPPSAANVQRLMDRARKEGRALSLALADDLDALALKASEILTAGDAVAVGVREVARRTVEQSQASAALIRKLAK